MSEQGPNETNSGNADQDLPVEPTGTPVAEEASIAPGAPARAASVQLRTAEGAGDASLMDPANQSLTDALRITFKLVQVAMIFLAGLFVFSGFQQVDEGERGVSLLFGRPVAVDLEPGFRFSAPYPFGELVKHGTGTLSPELGASFWPQVAEADLNGPIERLGRRRELTPGTDGSLITADLNIAHTQWQLTYRRNRVADFEGRLLRDFEDNLVRSAFERAVVQAVAETTIDEMLKPEGGTRVLAERVQRTTQEFLDRAAGVDADGNPLGVGLRVEDVALRRKIPPTFLLDRFAAVTSARTDAQRARTDAESFRGETLNNIAGLSASALLAVIDRYEEAIETGRSADAELILAELDEILEGTTESAASSGEVAGLLAEAASDRSAAVGRARGDLALFEAKLAQFNANPELMISRDWAEAYATFLRKPFVQTMRLPVGSPTLLVINEDPDIIKEIDREQKRAEAREALEEREAAFRRNLFQTGRGIEREEE